MKIIASSDTFVPPIYVELVTGNFYCGNAFTNEHLLEDIEELLNINGLSDLKSFALDEIELAIEAKKRVVLVNCEHYEGDTYKSEYRWFQIPDTIEI
jgi:hypothetical protein